MRSGLRVSIEAQSFPPPSAARPRRSTRALHCSCSLPMHMVVHLQLHACCACTTNWQHWARHVSLLSLHPHRSVSSASGSLVVVAWRRRIAPLPAGALLLLVFCPVCRRSSRAESPRRVHMFWSKATVLSFYTVLGPWALFRRPWP